MNLDSSLDSANEKTIPENVLDFRREKDKFFLQDSRSPIPKEKRKEFSGLHYFAFNPNLCFETVLMTDPELSETSLLTTTGDERPFVRWGWIDIKIDDANFHLALFATLGETEPEELFLPFRDISSGTETYGGGRYLNVPLMGKNAFIDFNMAYHPYCAYGGAFSCALPPRENWLSTSIRAGERFADESIEENNNGLASQH